MVGMGDAQTDVWCHPLSAEIPLGVFPIGQHYLRCVFATHLWSSQPENHHFALSVPPSLQDSVNIVLSPKRNSQAQAWWHSSVIPATVEVEVGELLFWASPGKGMRPYMKSKLKQKGMGCGSSESLSSKPSTEPHTHTHTHTELSKCPWLNACPFS
jgi:hypothetical protein